MISRKSERLYSTVINYWIKCHIGFSLIRSTIVCVCACVSVCVCVVPNHYFCAKSCDFDLLYHFLSFILKLNFNQNHKTKVEHSLQSLIIMMLNELNWFKGM